MLGELARRAGDAETDSVLQRILEQEEAAAQLVAGTFPRIVELALGEPARSPLPGVTPLGKPSERPPAQAAHQGPQSFKDRAADEPIDQPPHIDTPTDAPALPDPGYPADQTRPYREEVHS